MNIMEQWNVFKGRMISISRATRRNLDLAKAAFKAGLIAATLASGVDYDKEAFRGIVKDVDDFFKKHGGS